MEELEQVQQRLANVKQELEVQFNDICISSKEDGDDGASATNPVQLLERIRVLQARLPVIQQAVREVASQKREHASKIAQFDIGRLELVNNQIAKLHNEQSGESPGLDPQHTSERMKELKAMQQHCVN